MLRHLIAVGSMIAALGALSSCASPTLPLPPPSLPTVVAGSDADHVLLLAACGGAESDALVIVENDNLALTGSQVGAVARADGCGAWRADVYAHRGDVLQIWQEYGNETSPSEELQIGP